MASSAGVLIRADVDPLDHLKSNQRHIHNLGQLQVRFALAVADYLRTSNQEVEECRRCKQCENGHGLAHHQAWENGREAIQRKLEAHWGALKQQAGAHLVGDGDWDCQPARNQGRLQVRWP